MQACGAVFQASAACGHPSGQAPQGRARRPSALTPLPIPGSCGLVRPGCSGCYDRPPLVSSPEGSAPLHSLFPVAFLCQHCILAPYARLFLCYISFPNHYGCHPQGMKIEHKLHGGGKRGPSRGNTLQSRINSGSCGGACAG